MARRFRYNELIYDPIGSEFDGHFKRGPYGGHQHVHAAALNPWTMLAIIRWARARNMSVRENPYTDRVDPVHTEGSHHYQLFKGLFNGRRLGRAADISGTDAQERALFNWIRAQSGARAAAAGGAGRRGAVGGGAPQIRALQQQLQQPIRITPPQMTMTDPRTVLARFAPPAPPIPFPSNELEPEPPEDLLAAIRRQLLAA